MLKIGGPQEDEQARVPVIRELFASAGENVSVGTNLNCDYGRNISVGKNFLTNYNVTILDIAPVAIWPDDPDNSSYHVIATGK